MKSKWSPNFASEFTVSKLLVKNIPPLANMLLNCNLYTLVPFIDRYVVQNMICLHFSISLFIATFPLINLGCFCDPPPSTPFYCGVEITYWLTMLTGPSIITWLARGVSATSLNFFYHGHTPSSVGCLRSNWCEGSTPLNLFIFYL